MFAKIIYKNPGEPPRGAPKYERYEYFICRACWKLIHIPFFQTFILALIIGNTLILATDKYPAPEIDLIGETN